MLLYLFNSNVHLFSHENVSESYMHVTIGYKTTLQHGNSLLLEPASSPLSSQDQVYQIKCNEAIDSTIRINTLDKQE